jgi:ComF family protein
VTSLGRWADGAVDLLLPKRCVVCGRAGRWLCATCAAALVPLPATVCARCGAPLERPCGECRECRGRELAFASARAAFLYQGPARRLVTACKFRALRSLSGAMAELSQPAFERALAVAGRRAHVDLVTWVPVHRERDLERGFDQAALLARRLAAAAGLPCAPLLVRRRAGRRQSGLGAAARAENVREAFRLDDRMVDKAGRVCTVLVVDDVYTTGETLHACSIALRHAGCEPHAFTFARAARGFRSPNVHETTSDRR